MRTLYLLPLTFCLAPLASQTPTGTLETKSDAGVYAVTGTTKDFSSTKANTTLPPIGPFTWRLRASVNQGSGATGTSASLSTYGYVNSQGVTVVGLSGLARGTKGDEAYTTPTTTAPGQPGDLEFVMRLKSSPSRKGALRVSWQSLLKNNATSSASVDVDDDNKVEWKGGDTNGGVKTAIIPVAFDAKGQLMARLTLAGTVQGAGQYLYSSTYGRLDIRFIDANAGKCTITPYGKGCQGTAANGAVTTIGAQHVLTTKMTGGFANAFALEAIGSTQQNIPLPGGCTLLSNAITILVHKSDAKGEVQIVRKVSTFQRLSTLHQFLPLTLKGKDLVLRASNGLRVVCTGQ